LSRGLARRLRFNQKSTKSNLRKPRAFSSASSGRYLIRELDARKIPYRYLSPDQITNPRWAQAIVLEFHVNGIPYYFTNDGKLRIESDQGLVPGPLIDGKVARFLTRKHLINAYLRGQGVSVPRGRAFSPNMDQEAEDYFVRFCASVPHGVCVKPTNGSKGEQVYVGVKDLESFRKAFSAVGKTHDRARVLIEETVRGPIYRFTMVAGRVCMVEYMRPANIEGDGVHTISELVLLKNKQRKANPTHWPLQLGESQLAFLRESGLGPDDVPKAGTLVFLSSLSNSHQGGDCIEVGETLHPSYVEVLENVFRLFPGLVLCGADVAIPHLDWAATTGSYHMLELNCGPGFSSCHNPWRGQPRNIAGAILDYLVMHDPRVTRPVFGRDAQPLSLAHPSFAAA
jgi:cyanophycin synthetase